MALKSQGALDTFDIEGHNIIWNPHHTDSNEVEWESKFSTAIHLRKFILFENKSDNLCNPS